MEILKNVAITKIVAALLVIVMVLRDIFKGNCVLSGRRLDPIEIFYSRHTI